MEKGGEEGRMRTFVGEVVSDVMQKTVVVTVVRKTRHPLYKKILTRRKRYLVDLGNHNVARGDVVQIVETRPISKNKHFIVQNIIKSFQKKEEDNGTA